MEKLYIVSSSDPESYDPHYVLGPEVEDWECFLKGIWPEIKAKALNTMNNDTIREFDLCAIALEVLESYGYKETNNIPKYDYGWKSWELEDLEIRFHNGMRDLEEALDFDIVPERTVLEIKRKVASGPTLSDRLRILEEEKLQIWE